jgi:hypothetical protein
LPTLSEGNTVRRACDAPERITTEPERPRVVPEWPTRMNKHEIRSFLGLFTYYVRSIFGFAKVANPLRSKPSNEH